jgi:heme-degrading monooxygenase HmoA
MVRSILTLRAAPGREADLEAYFAEAGILERARAFPGCRGTELLRRLDPGAGTHVVVADWDSHEDYRRWQADPWRRQSSAGLLALLSPETDATLPGGVYDLLPL